MQEFTTILPPVFTFIFLVTNILLTYIFLTPRGHWGGHILAFAVAWVAEHLLRSLLQTVILDHFLLSYIVGLLYIIPIALIFKETLQAKLFVFFLIFSMSQFIILIFLFLEQLVFNQIVFIFMLTGALLEMASLPLIRRYVKPLVRDIIDIISQQNTSFTFFPVLAFILMSFYGVRANSLVANFIPLILSTLLLVYAYYLIARSIDQTKRHQALEKHLALQRDHYQNLYKSIADTKAIRHDLRHHLATLTEFLGKNNASAALEYINQLSRIYDDSFLPSVCSNKSADALIAHYLKMAKRLNIATATELNLPDGLGIDELDLCVILGNCLENAIEACSKIGGEESGCIDIKSEITKGHLLITITNSFNGLVLPRDGDRLLSTKKGADHGMGLSSVKALAAKYAGHFDSSFDQRVFKVSVSLKLPKNLAASG